MQTTETVPAFAPEHRPNADDAPLRLRLVHERANNYAMYDGADLVALLVLTPREASRLSMALEVSRGLSYRDATDALEPLYGASEVQS